MPGTMRKHDCWIGGNDMANFDKFAKEILADPAARKGYERHQASVLAGELVRQWRKRAGMTQAQLAEAIHSSQEAISKIESAAGSRGPHIGTLAIIADACGLEFQIGAVETVEAVAETANAVPENQVTVAFADDRDDSSAEELTKLADQLAPQIPSERRPQIVNVLGPAGPLAELVIPAITAPMSALLVNALAHWIRGVGRPVRVRSEMNITEFEGTSTDRIVEDLESILRTESADKDTATQA